MLRKGVSNWTQMKTCKRERYKNTFLAAFLGGCAFFCLPALLSRPAVGKMLLIWDGRIICWERRYISWVISSRFRDTGPSGFSLKCCGCSLDQHQNSCLWGQHHDLTARVAQNVCPASGRMWAEAWPDSPDTMRYRFVLYCQICVDFSVTSYR